MRKSCALLALLTLTAHAQNQDFTVKAALSAPYAWALTAAPPPSSRFAWIENAEGVRNIWVASATEPAHQITTYTEDDGQDITGLAWSPDAGQVAYTLGAEAGASGRPANPANLQRDTATAIYIASVSSAEQHRVTEGRSPLWLDSGTLLFTRTGKIFIAPLVPSTTVAVQLIYDRGSASTLTLSPDGKHLAYVSRRGHHSFIGLFDLQAKTLRFVAPSTGIDTAPTFSRDGHQLAWLREPATEAPEFASNRTSANPWSVMVADVATLTPRAVYTPTANKRGSVIPRFATGDPRIWWAANDTLLFCSEADGWNHLYSVDAKPPRSVSLGEPKLLTPLDGEVEDVSVGPDGAHVYFASNMRESVISAGPPARERWELQEIENDKDRRHLWRIDLAHANKLQILSGDGIEPRPLELADGNIAALAGDTQFPMHAVLFAKDGTERDIHADWPESYPGEQFVEPKQVEFRSPDALRLNLHGQLFLPKAGTAKHPAILFFHGGPRRQMLLGYPAMDYYSNAYAMNQYFAAHGYIVLSVNYRCGIGYGLNFRQCVHTGADGASEYNDALAAVAYLRTRSDVDMKRIGIWGGSYGGYFVALGLTRNSDIFRAGVDFHGIYDWTLEDNAPTDWLRGTETERNAIAARAKASSPIADVTKWKSPVLLIHGDDDPEVAFAQTPANADALRARGVHVEELIFPDEVHDFLLHRDWVKAYEAMADFFARELR